LLKAPELQRLSAIVEVLRVEVMIVGVISVGVMTVRVLSVGVMTLSLRNTALKVEFIREDRTYDYTLSPVLKIRE
jgi:hypothetical protein